MAAVTVVSEAERESLVATGVDAAKVHVVPNGADGADLARPRAVAAPPRLIYPGRDHLCPQPRGRGLVPEPGHAAGARRPARRPAVGHRRHRRPAARSHAQSRHGALHRPAARRQGRDQRLGGDGRAAAGRRRARGSRCWSRWRWARRWSRPRAASTASTSSTARTCCSATPPRPSAPRCCGCSTIRRWPARLSAAGRARVGAAYTWTGDRPAAAGDRGRGERRYTTVTHSDSSNGPLWPAIRLGLAGALACLAVATRAVSLRLPAARPTAVSTPA